MGSSANSVLASIVIICPLLSSKSKVGIPLMPYNWASSALIAACCHGTASQGMLSKDDEYDSALL